MTEPMRISLIFFVILSVCRLGLQAQFTATAEFNTVPMGQPFQVVYKIETTGQPSGFMPPNFGGAFRLVSGPNESRQMININGQVSGSVSYGYMLVGQKLGKFTIPAASVTANGKRLSSNSLTIEIVKGVGGNTGGSGQVQVQKIPPQNAPDDDTPAEYAKKFAEDIKMQAILDKKSVYVGEQVRLVYRLYTRNTLSQPEQTHPPVYEGFWTEDLQPGRAIQQDAMLNGRAYSAYDIKKVLLFPQKTGELVIPEYELQANVEVHKSAQSLLQQFFGSGGAAYQALQVPYRFRSAPISLNVKPLPEAGKPKDFTGAVGEFSMQAALSKRNALTGEPIHLTITFSGNGNLKMLEAPQLVLPASFERYDPESSDNLTKDTDDISGSRTFDYTITPNEVGNFEIQPIKFYFFNPNTARYDSLTSSPFAIKVEKGNGTKSSEDETQTNDFQLRSLHTGDFAIQSLNAPWLSKGIFHLLYFTPLLMFGAWLVYYRRRKLETPDPQALRLQNANLMVQKRLSTAKLHLQNNDNTAFHKEIIAAIWGYLGDKLGMKTADLSQEKIQEVLQLHNVQAETIANLTQLINTCEMAIFAPAARTTDLTSVLDAASQVMNEIETTLNRGEVTGDR